MDKNKIMNLERTKTDNKKKQNEGERADEEDAIPHTPVRVIQRVGISLGIAEEDLTPAKLMVEPKKKEAPKDKK